MSVIGLGLFLGGCVATVGGHVYIYFSPFKLWGIFLLFALSIFLAAEGISRLKTTTRVSVRRSLRYLLLTLLVFMAISQVSNLHKSDQAAKDDSYVKWSDQLGGYINSAFIPQTLHAADERLMEEYWGLASVIEPGEEKTKVDSVIHALGDMRNIYKDRLVGTNVRVVTSSPAIGSWFSWNLSANWWFYKELFLKFSPVENTPLTYLWTRDLNIGTWKNTECEVAGDKKSILLTSTKKQMYNVFVEYSGPGKYSRRFSMIQNNLNTGGGGNGFVSIDPSSKSQEFPAIGEVGSTRLYLKDISNNGNQVTFLKSCLASEITFPKDSKKSEILNSFFVASNTPMNFTDANWTSGVSNSVKAFFVGNTSNNRDAFKAGKSVQFANGDVIKVVAVEVTGEYINVFFDGDKFDPEIYGFPNKFNVMD
jgi:hypothetical protein